MQIVIDIHNAPIKDYQDLYYKIHGMAASEGLFDDKEKSQRALALKAVLDVLEGVVNGTPLPKGHGDLVDYEELKKNAREYGTYAEATLSHIKPKIIIEADKAGSEEIDE